MDERITDVRLSQIMKRSMQLSARICEQIVDGKPFHKFDVFEALQFQVMCCGKEEFDLERK